MPGGWGAPEISPATYDWPATGSHSSGKSSPLAASAATSPKRVLGYVAKRNYPPFRTKQMSRSQQPALTLFAIGLIGLAILALIYGDFALVWQPVAPWVPGRTFLAYASGLLMLFGGI